MLPNKVLDRNAGVRRVDELGKKVVDNPEMRSDRSIQLGGFLECVDENATGL